ncbi:hypothetical protein OG871_06105 [Kitasatospora sp. NBC_00374]|uniref:hypothetical protein n=1 Tax=Kitasatospora sp. NBC_00374 TaxID=2975964 RepID=UPI0030E304C4
MIPIRKKRSALALVLAAMSVLLAAPGQASADDPRPPFLGGSGAFGVNDVDVNDIVTPFAGARPEYRRSPLFQVNSRDAPFYADDPFYAREIFARADAVAAEEGTNVVHFELFAWSIPASDSPADHAAAADYQERVRTAFVLNVTTSDEASGWRCVRPTYQQLPDPRPVGGRIGPTYPLDRHNPSTSPHRPEALLRQMARRYDGWTPEFHLRAEYVRCEKA